MNDDELRRYLEEASEEPALSADDEQTLMREMRAGKAGAKEKLIRGHMRLVVSIARRYADKVHIPLVRLVPWGHSGLEHAAERFGPSRGYKLSYYATWYIRQAITRRLAEEG